MYVFWQRKSMIKGYLQQTDVPLVLLRVPLPGQGTKVFAKYTKTVTPELQQPHGKECFFISNKLHPFILCFSVLQTSHSLSLPSFPPPMSSPVLFLLPCQAHSNLSLALSKQGSGPTSPSPAFC